MNMKQKIITFIANLLGEKVHFNDQPVVNYTVQEHQSVEVRSELTHAGGIGSNYVVAELMDNLMDEIRNTGAIEMETIKMNRPRENGYSGELITRAKLIIQIKK